MYFLYIFLCIYAGCYVLRACVCVYVRVRVCVCVSEWRYYRVQNGDYIILLQVAC
jgi:hypothetical protein